MPLEENDFPHCPFEIPANNSKGQCRNSKHIPPLLLAVKVDQNIFFPETCFASTNFEPEFTVCDIQAMFLTLMSTDISLLMR